MYVRLFIHLYIHLFISSVFDLKELMEVPSIQSEEASLCVVTEDGVQVPVL